MAFIPVPNTVEAHIIQSLLGEIIENTLYFVWPEAVLASEVAQLAASVGTWFLTSQLPNLSEQLTYLRTETQDLTTEGAPAYTDATGVGTPGGVAHPSLPGGTAFCASFRTALGGRSFRGRNYVGGVDVTSQAGNQITSAAGDLMIAAYNALPAAVAADLPDAQWCVVSRYHLGAPRTSGVTTPVITAVATNYDLDSQRRRLAGRGT